MMNKHRKFRLHRVSWLFVFLIPFFGSGCNRTSQPEDHRSQTKGKTKNGAANNSTILSNRNSKSGEPNVQQRIQFNLDKLKDHSYTDTYGHDYTWYTAAEELGKIGKPAVPHLIRKLTTQDQYELKLSLYALQLATQDSKVKSLTGGKYIKLNETLTETSNSKNKAIALQWWKRHKHIFNSPNQSSVHQ